MDDRRWAQVSGSGTRRIYRLLCLVAYCDHDLHPAERVLLEAYRRRFGLSPEEAAGLEAEGRAGHGVRLGRDPLEQRLLLEAMIDVAASDGRIEPREQKRLLKIAGAIGLGQAELVALVRARFARDRLGGLIRDGGTSSSLGGFFAPLPPKPGAPAAPSPAPAAARAPSDPPSDRFARPPQEHKTAPGIPLHVVRAQAGRPPIPPTHPSLEVSRAVPPTTPPREAPRLPLTSELEAPRGLDDGPAIPELRPPPPEPSFRVPPTLGPFPAASLDEATPPAGVDAPFAEAPPTPDPERARRAAEATPRPDDPLAAAAPVPPALAKQHESSLSLSPGVIVLLGVQAPEMRIDLTRLPVRPEFRGFDRVPPGLHHVTALAPDGTQASLWVNLGGGGVVVKVFDAKQRRFVDPAPLTLERYGTVSQARGLGPALVPYPYDAAVDWVELTVHLDPDRFPPPLKAGDPPGWPSRLEAVWRGTHAGDGQALLTELAWSFLAGVLERHPAAYERWLTLFKACLTADPQPLAEDPALFVLLADLLVAQLHQLPDRFLDRSVSVGLEELAETYELTRVPHLAEAGARLQRALAGRKAAAR